MKVKEILEKHPELTKEEFEGCSLCGLYEYAYDEFVKVWYGIEPDAWGKIVTKMFDGEFYRPVCPKCGKPLEPCGMNGHTTAIIGGSNSVDPDEEFFPSNLWYCLDCDQDYAMYPVPVEYNANHNIYYTGGKSYLTSDMETELQESIDKKITASVTQYTRRIKNPEDETDKMLSPWNLVLWIKRDVTEAVAEILYKYGFKK